MYSFLFDLNKNVNPSVALHQQPALPSVVLLSTQTYLTPPVS